MFKVSTKNYLQSDFGSEETCWLSLYNIFVFFSGLDAANKEIKTLTASVDILKLEKREHVQSKCIKLFMV